MKPKRQEKILEIIATRNIETQEDLISALRSEGFNATQATASRDIRQLQLVKVLDNGVYKYVAPRAESEISGTYNYALFASILDIKYALNNVVIKTHAGSANTVGKIIDEFNFNNVLGTIAGDDTLLMVLVSKTDAEVITQKIKEIVSNA